MDEDVRVTLRIRATPSQLQALVDAWLHGTGTINIKAGDVDMEVPLTYIKEA